MDPNGKELLSQDHVSDAEFTFDVKDGGDYKICLDNSFDSESKIVTLALDHHLPDEMTLLFEKLSKNQDNMKGPPNFVVSKHHFTFSILMSGQIENSYCHAVISGCVVLLQKLMFIQGLKCLVELWRIFVCNYQHMQPILYMRRCLAKFNGC